MDDVTRAELSDKTKLMIEIALAASSKATDPITNYPEGAAVIGSDDKIYPGCSVGNDTLTGTSATHGAIHGMVVSGAGLLKEIAVANPEGKPPDGGGLQHIWQYCGYQKDTPVYLVSIDGGIKRCTVGELLPGAFTLAKK